MIGFGPKGLRIALIVVCVSGSLSLTFGGLMQFLPGSGYAPWQDRASTAIRAIGLGPVLDRIENFAYTRHAPPDSPPQPSALIADSSTVRSVATPPYPGLPYLATTADHVGWHPMLEAPGTSPVAYTALIEPDAAHRSVVATIALLRSTELTAHLAGGTAQPPGTGASGRVPPAELAGVVATFNSGFKFSDHPGGFYLDGTAAVALEDGRASAVVDDRGRLLIGQWGRDLRLGPHVRAVRQNLALIVEHGQPSAGLAVNQDHRWGSPRNQLQYTWRSGLGVTAAGDVVYAAGDKLTLSTLARALAQAGAVCGMELDIHSGLQSFSLWLSDAGGGRHPHSLISTMSGPADRYVNPDTRDFFYFTTRSPQR